MIENPALEISSGLPCPVGDFRMERVHQREPSVMLVCLMRLKACFSVAGLLGACFFSVLATSGLRAQDLPVVANLDLELQPGVTHEVALGPASTDRSYIVEVSPLEGASDGDFVELARVLPEFDGVEWIDLLQVQIPAGTASSLMANIRVYATTGLPALFDFNFELNPGVWHGFIVGPASESRGFVTEATPEVDATNGDIVEARKVQQEFNGVQWNDVLRVQIPAGASSSLETNLRVYDTSGLQVITDFNFELQPGVAHGFILGEALEDRAYIVETTPLEGGNDGAFIEIAQVQPEFNGTEWNDVLRVQIPAGTPVPLNANIRAYGISPRPTLVLYDPIGDQASNAQIPSIVTSEDVSAEDLGQFGFDLFVNTHVWPVGHVTSSKTLEPSQYLSFTVTPENGLGLNLDRLKVSNISYAGGGPSDMAVRSSVDGFSANIDTAPALPQIGRYTSTLSLDSLPRNLTDPVELRVYYWGGSGSDFADVSSTGVGESGLSLEGFVAIFVADFESGDTSAWSSSAP